MEDNTKVDQATLDKKARKKQRKEERRKLRAQQEATTTEDAQTEEQPVVEESEKKKKKKKSKQPEATEEQQESVADVVEEQNSDKKKKKKKEKRAQEEVQEEAVVEPSKKDKKKRSRDEEQVEQIEQHNGKKSKDSKHSANGHSNNNNNNNAAAAAGGATGSFRKHFYKEHPNLASFTAEQVKQYRTQHTMTLSDVVNVDKPVDYKPVRTFAEAGFPAQILNECKNFKTPTPIQAQCWPVVLSGRDVVGIAETGSGKTLAFTLPALVHIMDQPPVTRQSRGPVVLVLSPTRELAMQTSVVAEEMGAACGLRSVCIYGGVAKQPQYDALNKGVHIVVATPGRLIDLMNEGNCSLSRVTFLVLDEADRMLDMGFEPDIRRIVSQIRPDRQTVMFSATWPSAIQKLAHEFLSKPVKVTIGSEDLSANHRVQQIVEVVEGYEKDRKLIDLLKKYHSTRKNRVLVFVLYKKEATRVEEFLQRQKYNCVGINADKSQQQRTQALEQFKSGEQPLLIATDVAARGLDIPDVELVINYTFPLTIEDYIHRIGRTGRAGKEGISYTFFTAHDKLRAAELSSVLREANQPVPEALLPLCSAGTKKKEHKLYGAHFKDVNPFDAAKQPTKIKFDADDD